MSGLGGCPVPKWAKRWFRASSWWLTDGRSPIRSLPKTRLHIGFGGRISMKGKAGVISVHICFRRRVDEKPLRCGCKFALLLAHAWPSFPSDPRGFSPNQGHCAVQYKGGCQVIKHENERPAFSLSLTPIHSLRHRLVRSRQYACQDVAPMSAPPYPLQVPYHRTCRHPHNI